VSLSDRLIALAARIDPGRKPRELGDCCPAAMPTVPRVFYRGAVFAFRTRDGDGQFAPESGDGGPTPSAMAKVYGSTAIRATAGLTGAGLLGALLRRRFQKK
jgi:hypothetical protein